MPDELQTFISLWNYEANKSADLLRALPANQYDFRPDPQARSLGELAWHLAEVDAYTTYGIEQGSFQLGVRPPGIERPRSIQALAPGYERIHADAVERVRKLTAGDLDRKLRHFTGNELSIRELLWGAVLFHMIHHRGQLSILCRLAGGGVPSLFGPNREEMAALRAARA
ncbi:MAG: DinB family protein [Silvibacterium sp.]|nr:DinB family protein [Silvibacterium sp.]